MFCCAYWLAIGVLFAVGFGLLRCSVLCVCCVGFCGIWLVVVGLLVWFATVVLLVY